METDKKTLMFFSCNEIRLFCRFVNQTLFSQSFSIAACSTEDLMIG